MHRYTNEYTSRTSLDADTKSSSIKEVNIIINIK